MLLAFHPVFVSGFAIVPGDRGDTIHFLTLLEHGWLWLSGGASAPAFWSPPIGFPRAGALAHGDVMISFAPFYSTWRALGADPETALQLFYLSVAIANYAAMFVLLRRFGASTPLGAGLGAGVFAFSSALMAHLGHPQLLPQVFVLGALGAALTFCETTPETADRAGSSRAEPTAIAVFLACLCLQLWGSFYLGYFVVLVSGVALAIGLARSATRPDLLDRLRRNRVPLGVGLATSALALAPLAIRYLEARAISQRVGVGAGELRLPRLASYFSMGPESVFYGWTASLPPFAWIPEPHEQAIGLGIVTTSVVAFVAWRARDAPTTRFVALVVVVLVVALTMFPFEIRLWRLWYYTIPGLGAVRAVSRLGLFLTIPAAFAVARFVSGRVDESASTLGRDRRSARRTAGLVAIGVLCLVEQARVMPGFDKARWQCEVDALVARIDPAADAFHLTGNHGDNLQALRVAQQAGKPTVNFVGGAFPIDWTLFDVQIRETRSEAEIRAELRRYLERKGVDPGRVQVLWPERGGRCTVGRARERA
ncbi:MAG: hypothetical protein NXI30_16175 [bacterium]|nr:hypothetical protein [bacterium]